MCVGVRVGARARGLALRSMRSTRVSARESERAVMAVIPEPHALYVHVKDALKVRLLQLLDLPKSADAGRRDQQVARRLRAGARPVGRLEKCASLAEEALDVLLRAHVPCAYRALAAGRAHRGRHAVEVLRVAPRHKHLWMCMLSALDVSVEMYTA